MEEHDSQRIESVCHILGTVAFDALHGNLFSKNVVCNVYLSSLVYCTEIIIV